MAPSPDHPTRRAGRVDRLATVKAAGALAAAPTRFAPRDIERFFDAGISLETATEYAAVGLDTTDTLTAAGLGLSPAAIVLTDPTRAGSEEQRLLCHDLYLQTIQAGLVTGFDVLGFWPENNEPWAADGYRYVTCEAAHPDTRQVVTVRTRFDTNLYGAYHLRLQRLTGDLLARGSVQQVANPDLVTPSPHPNVFDVTEVLLTADQVSTWARFMFERRNWLW